MGKRRPEDKKRKARGGGALEAETEFLFCEGVDREADFDVFDEGGGVKDRD